MGYLVTQIIFYLLISLLIGSLIGWLLRGKVCSGCQKKILELKTKHSELEKRYVSLETGKRQLEEEDLQVLEKTVSSLQEENRLQADKIRELEEYIESEKTVLDRDMELAAENKRLKDELRACRTVSPAPELDNDESEGEDDYKPDFSRSQVQGEPDDLKKIKGIGPVMENVLNELGILYFHQIKALSERDVEWVSSKIGTFPDRIKRDEWLKQAEKLDKERQRSDQRGLD